MPESGLGDHDPSEVDMAINAAGVLTLVLLAAGSDPTPAVGPEEFRRWFDRAAEGRLRIPEEVRARALGFRYVFVGGLGNERMPDYFAQNVAALEALGVPPGAIHEIRPSSHAGLAENLDAVRAGFLDAEAGGPERLVVIAHSRGACDALAFALREPGFVRDHVAAFFLVQGPFGGTGLADYVLGEGEPMDRQMPRRARVVAKAVGGLERASLRRGRHGGLEDLTRDASREFWRGELEAYADAIPVVGPRIFFVEASVPPSRQRLARKPLARYLHAYYGPNDGVVLESDQSLEGLGTRLGPLDVGHTDLTHRFPAARARPKLRRALVESIVMAVGRESPVESDRD
jgi:pimeloyl-ACP methyl ester carboxylesterase